MNDQPSFFQSKTFKGVLYGIACVIVLLLTFQAGVMVGYRRADFSYRWAENYSGNFFPHPRNDFMRQMDNRDFIKGQGALGLIIKIDNNVLVVKSEQRDVPEQAVLMKNDTVIERGFDILKSSDLKVGDHVVVIGSPNDAGQVEAKIIRVLPNLTTFMMGHPPLSFETNHPLL